MKTWIGIDNGTSGTIGIIGDTIDPIFIHNREYTRKQSNAKSSARELDIIAFSEIVTRFSVTGAVIERPFTGSYRNSEVAGAYFHGSARAILELKLIPFIQVDSRHWQKPLLGIDKFNEAGLTKRLSKSKGILRWPMLREQIDDHGDADGMFLAVHAMHQFP